MLTDQMDNSKPRLLFISRKWPPAVGGMETYSYKLVEAAKTQMDVQTFVLPGQSNGRPPKALSLLVFGLKVAIAVLFKKPTATYIHGGDLAIWPLVWLASLRQKNAKFSISVHGVDFSYGHGEGIKARLYRIYLRAARRCLPHTEIIANSQATAKLMESSGFEQLRTLPLRIRDHKTLIPLEKKPEVKYLFFSGRMDPRKGLTWFSQTVLPDLPPDIVLKIAGMATDPKLGGNTPSSKIQFLGILSEEDLATHRRNALAVIIPNIDLGSEKVEGFGLAASEASLTGGVVLASDLQGLKDAVENGHTGFLLPPSNAKAWIDKISEVLNWSTRDRERFLAQQKERISQWPDWEKYVKLLFRLKP